MYITVRADLNQAEEFFPPSTIEYVGVKELLADFVMQMHDPVETLLQDRDRNWQRRHYVFPQFVVHNQVWARFIFNSDLDYTSTPVANNFRLDVEAAEAEGRPHTVTFTNEDGKTLDLHFHSGTEEMNRIYMEWDLEAHPGHYDEWVMYGQGPIVEGY